MKRRDVCALLLTVAWPLAASCASDPAVNDDGAAAAEAGTRDATTSSSGASGAHGPRDELGRRS